MNIDKQNFEYYGFAEEIIPEAIEGIASVYSGVATNKKNQKFEVDLTVFNDGSFDVAAQRPNGEVSLTLHGAPLISIEDILKLIDILGLKMIHDAHPIQYHRWKDENDKTFNKLK